MFYHFEKYLFHSACGPILRVLFAHTVPLSLRAISRLSDLQLRSVQLALEALEKEQIVIKTRYGKRHLFELNLAYHDYPQLKEVMQLLAKHQIRKQTDSILPSVPAILNFINQQYCFFNRSRR